MELRYHTRGFAIRAISVFRVKLNLEFTRQVVNFSIVLFLCLLFTVYCLLYLRQFLYLSGLAVQRVGNAIHRINRYPVDSMICFANTYPVDSGLYFGWRYPAFVPLGPVVLPDLLQRFGYIN